VITIDSQQAGRDGSWPGCGAYSQGQPRG
jgi:hypothetical protein